MSFDPRPPLGRQLARYLLDWLDANDPESPTVTRWPEFAPTEDPLIVGPGPWRETKLLPVVRGALEEVAAQDAASPEEPHFEPLMDRWAGDSKTRHQLELTQRLLSYSMNFGHRCAFLEQRDLFDDLLATWNPSVIVTVNYDLLVEQGLWRRGMRDVHPAVPMPSAPGSHVDLVSDGAGPIVPLFKLHGSVNWLPVREGAGGADLKMVQELSRQNPMTPRPNEQEPGDDRTPLHSYDTKHTFEPPNGGSLRVDLEHGFVPVLAAYGPRKPLLRNLEHIRAHRQACADLLAAGPVGRVLAVGVRPVTVEDDRTLHDLIRQLGALPVEKIYVSPAEEHCEWFEAQGFMAVRKGLAHYLAGA
jgi:hypothetical protein